MVELLLSSIFKNDDEVLARPSLQFPNLHRPRTPLAWLMVVDNSASSSSADGTPLASLDVGETCAFEKLDVASGCRAPRSCRSCLQIAGCMVDPAGSCVSTRDEPYDPKLDFRRAMEAGLTLPNATADSRSVRSSQIWQFPAGMAQYCRADDSVCSACTIENFGRSSSSYPDSRYCVGENGCVCIDVCERRWFVEPDCSSGSGPLPSSARKEPSFGVSNANMILLAVAGAIVFVMFLTALLFQARKAERASALEQEERRRGQEGARQQRRHARSSALGVSPLNLTGWAKYRRDQQDKETARNSDVNVDPTRGGASADDQSSGDDRVHVDGSETCFARLEDAPDTTTTTTAPSSVERSLNPTASRSTLAPLAAVRQHPIV